MKIILICCIFLAHAVVFAQPGTLDRSFGDTGVVLSTTYSGTCSSISIQSDEKILAFEDGGYDSTGGFLTVRYNTDGTLDESFGDEGRVVTSFPGGNSNLISGSLLENQKIIVCGRTILNSKVVVTLVKYLPDGTIDSSFGINGIVQTRVKNNTQAVDMAIQPDGKIVVGGWIINADNEPRQGFLVRYMPDGSLDKSFADQGILIFDQVTYNIYSLSTIALQQDGKILIAGNSTSLKGIIFRFNADGSIDKNFGAAGEASADIIINDMVVEREGSILLAGDAANNMVVRRLLSTGFIDSDFGINGLAIAQFENNLSESRAIILQGDGKIITAGNVHPKFYEYEYCALARFLSNGKLDSSFAINGKQITSILDFDDIEDALLQPDGKIILGGYTFTENPFFYHLVLARYNNDAALPLQFTYFNAVPTNNSSIALSWQTAQENNNEYFAVQRSGDSRFRGNDENVGGNDGSDIARINSKGNSSQAQTYSYTDNTPLQGTNFYRLKQVDKDGRFSYSQIISATLQNGLSVVLYPNPVKDVLNIKGLSSINNYELLIMNTKGNAVASTKINNTSNYKWNLQTLSKGVYYLNIISNQKTTTVKFVKE